MANQDLKESVLLNLRSVTQSIKGGVPFERLQRDYKDLLGAPIPFKDLGYNSLEAFIRDIPHVIALRKGSDGQLMAVGVADASTAHIVSLVSRQKTDTKKKPFRKPPPHYGMRKSLSYRAPFREGSRGGYSRYTSPPHQPVRSIPKSKLVKPPSPPVQQHSKPRPPSPPVQQYSKPRPPSPPVQQHFKPRIPSEQVPNPARKYEVAPRFLKLKEMKNGVLPQESSSFPTHEPTLSPRSTSPTFSSSPAFSYSDSVETIPPPRAVARSLPLKPQPIESSRAVQLEALESARTAKEFIEIHSKMNKIKPVYHTLLFGQKAKSKGYVSTLRLGEKSYRSYPELKPTEFEAEEEAAKRAMEEIKERKEHLLPETPYSNADEINILLTRIEEIVREKPSGMFANGILREYELKYNERLPSCWSNFLEQSDKLDFEELHVQYGKVPEGANIIVRTRESSSGNRTPSSTSSKSEYLYEDLDTKSLKKTLVEISLPKVPDFVIPTGNVWDVFITYVNGWISARLLDFYDDFLALSEEMGQFYKSRNFPVKEIYENQVYAAYIDDNPDIWHRVIVEDIKEDGLVSCYFVDEGDFSFVKQENLQEMTPAFLKLPYQAVHLSLDGLEDFENCINNEVLEKYLLAKTLIAEVKRWYPIKEFFQDVSGIHQKVYSVVLYDTSDSSGVDINLNDLLKESAIESLMCKLPTLSTSTCAYLSHVTQEGLVYLRLTNPQDCWIEQEMDRLAPVFEEASSIAAKMPSNTVCAAKYESGTWHRATVFENSVSADPELVEVFFIDYGHVGVVGKSEICEIGPISDLLASVPPQAICCELLNALPSSKSKWTEAATAKLMELAPFDQELIIRVMNEGDDKNLAKVNLYKRNQDSNIISINDSLACNPTLFYVESSSIPAKVPSVLPLHQQNARKSSLKSSLSNVIPDVAMPAEEQMARRLKTSVSSEKIEWLNTPDNIKSPDAFEIKSPVSLSVPPVPEKGELFNVFVTMAANPYNFVVQPFDSCTELDSLMKEMQSFYSVDDNLLEMDLSMLRKNEYYAALHSDNSWYRVRIEQIIASGPVMVAVHFVDFGDFNTVGINKLQPLYQKFKQLPYQAIKASLTGIKPLGSDWDTEQVLKFQEIVTEKPFVSVVHKKRIEVKNDISSLHVELTLIDTRDTAKDIYIHELLIEKNIAQRQ